MSISRSLISAALVVVCLALAGPGLVLASDLEPVSAAPDAVVTIDGDGVHPRELRVTAGDVVEWRNVDGERHRMRSRTGPSEFDSGDLETGERYRIRFSAAGTYPYIDERNDDASAWHGRIIVVAAGMPADPDPTGATPNAPNAPDSPIDPATTATVVLGDDFVDPAAVRILTGGSVTFRNEGEDEHSATATDGGPIDSGVLSGGATYRATFPESGTFAFMCIFHSEMQGTVTVVAPATSNGATPTPPPPAASPDPTPAASSDATPSASADPGAIAPDQVDVDIIDLEFRAPDVTVAAGGLVTWANLGEAPHTVTASDGSFDSDILEPGAGFERRFETPGTFAYLCELHPGMTGTVEVVAATSGGVPAAGAGAGAAAAPPAGDGDSDTTEPLSAGPAALAASALGDLAGLILAVVAVSAAVALFAKVIRGTVRPGTAYRPE